MKRGFRFAETMSGTWTRFDAPELPRALEFSVEAHADSLWRHLRDGKARLAGTLHAEELAKRVPVEGVLTLRPVRGRFIRYELAFTGDDGQPYRINGQKDLQLSDPVRSLTRLPGEVCEARSGRTIGRCEVHFNLRSDLIDFLRSWRRS